MTDTKSRRKTIAVDFDGVIADYDGWKGADVLGPVRPDVRDALNFLRDEGWKIIVHTTRSPEAIARYLQENQIAFDELNFNSDYDNVGTKPVATVYWDDRAVCYSGDATKDLEMIRAFKTWSGRE